MEPNSRRSLSYQTGFTLVELMVGLGIGMLATVIIIQVISVFEAQRRTTTGTADAQTNGGIALYNIGRELQLAGYPLMPVTSSALACTTVTGTVNGSAASPSRLSPVAIADGVAAAGVSASDTITIRYGNAPMGGVPTLVNAAPTGFDANVDNNFGCQNGDITLIANGTTCAMSKVNAAVAVAKKITLADTTGANTGAYLACMGAWNEISYRVNGGNLERCDLASAVALGGNCIPGDPNSKFTASVAGIVNLQAQYGVSASANSNQITQWVEATGGTWSAPAPADRNRIKAVRIAVVARNAKMEQAAVTTACSSTNAAVPPPTGLCAWAGSGASPAPAVDLSTGDPNWASYRYRVFETIVPLRNIVWSKGTL
jgi:type IV pilus assembly protein PilW